jgi:hypothetical protein
MAGRRGNREGSIYRRKDGRWVGAVTEAPGKRSVVYGATRRDVQTELAKLLKAQADGLPIAGKRLTNGAVPRALSRRVGPPDPFAHERLCATSSWSGSMRSRRSAVPRWPN